MKKKYAKIILITLSFFLLTGCGKKEEIEKPAPPPIPVEEVKETEDELSAEETLKSISIPTVFRVVTNSSETTYAPSFLKVMEFDTTSNCACYEVKTDFGGFLIYLCDNGTYMYTHIANEECSFYTEAVNPIPRDDVVREVNGILNCSIHGSYIGENEDAYMIKYPVPHKYLLDARYLCDAEKEEEGITEIGMEIAIDKKLLRPSSIKGVKDDAVLYESTFTSLSSLSCDENSFMASYIVDEEVFNKLFTMIQSTLSSIRTTEDMDGYIQNIIDNEETLETYYLGMFTQNLETEETEEVEETETVDFPQEEK